MMEGWHGGEGVEPMDGRLRDTEDFVRRVLATLGSANSEEEIKTAAAKIVKMLPPYKLPKQLKR